MNQTSAESSTESNGQSNGQSTSELTAGSISILIADDHSFFRDGLRLFIENVANFELVGEVNNAIDVITYEDRLNPDVILMDVNMPPSNGIQATKEIVVKNPNAKILMLTMFDDDDNVFKALQAGAKGYILKGLSHENLVRSINLVASGSAVYGSNIAERIMDYFSNSKPQDSTHFESLTLRENEVLKLVSQGLRNKDIAARCEIQDKTVRNHVTNILSKLQVATRSEAIAKYQEGH